MHFESEWNFKEYFPHLDLIIPWLELIWKVWRSIFKGAKWKQPKDDSDKNLADCPSLTLRFALSHAYIYSFCCHKVSINISSENFCPSTILWQNSIYQQTIVVKLNRLLGRFIDAIIDSFAEIQKMKDCKTEILLQSEI